MVDENNHRIQKFNSADNYLTKWGKEGSGDGQFYYPNRITIDLLGDIYVTDASNHRIQKFDSSGNFLTKWGTEGSGNGQFVNPSGITIDSTGKIYVVDTSNNRIQKFDSSGNYLTKWGTQGASNGQLTNPQDIAMNSVGDIYIADTNNNRIQKYTYSKISTSPPAGGYSLTEGGSSKSYSLVLNAAPTKNTTISLSVSNPVSGSSITTSPSTLMFTASNWSTPQTVVISPDNDAIRTGDRVASIQYTVTSNDNTFSCVPLDETEIQIAEDDAPPTATPTPTQAPTSTPQPAPTLPPDIQKRLDEGYDVNGVCVAQIPGGMPEIFRIDMSDTKATLYIAPPSKPYGTFTISYQEVGSVTWGFEHPVYAGSPEYAIDFSHTDDGGVVVYTINDLRPNTRYEFKVKCANKCASTSYGNTVAAATNTLGATSLKTYTTGNHTLTRTTGVTKTSSSLLTNAGSPAGLAMITGFILLTLGVGVYRMKSKTPPITLSLDRPLYTKDNPRKIRVPPRTRGG